MAITFPSFKEQHNKYQHNMSKTSALSFFLVLLLLSSLTHAARLEPKDTSASIHQLEVSSGEKITDVGLGGCKGLEEEECLKRRTLAAHLDYIYTQGKNH